jgi:glycosyltransferase involved in cell wall biosynthesis
MKCAVVIPGYNEERYLAKVLKKVKKASDLIIYVDDGSIDRSPQIGQEHTSHVLIHEVNLGKGAAMRTGAEYAFGRLKADAIIFIDADDQHDPREIPKFEDSLRQSDAVFGVRSMGPSVPMIRYMGNKLASVLLNALFGGYIEDIPSGYKGFTKRAYKKIVWNSTGYEVETEIAVRVLKNKLKYTSIGIEAIYHDTDKGMTLLDAIHISWCLMRWKFGM